MKKVQWIVLLITIVLSAAACSDQKSAVTETTIEAKKNGSIVHTIVEEFAEDYYSLDDLEQMMQEACDTYNASAGDGSVIIEDTALTDGVLTSVMRYQDDEDYTSFNKVALFTGTIQEAVDSGYNLNVKLLPADGGEISIGKEEILEMGDRHLMILREAVDVKVWDDVLYYTMNVMGTQDPKKVKVMSQDTLTFIVFK